MSEKMEQIILQKLDGQKNKQHCPKCNKDTIYIYHKSGVANCTEPGCVAEAKIDLSEYIKQLKANGVIVC